MARINLLPWREELRRERTVQFIVMAVIIAAVAVAADLAVHVFNAGQISNQNNRNGVLKAEIQKLDAKIVKIKELESTKERLIARMNVIQNLQTGRPVIVHMFDEMAKTLPDGVYVDSIAQQGEKLSVKGVAQSNARVSAYMQNIDESGWLADPKLLVIESKLEDKTRVSKFDLELKQDRKKEKGQEGS